MDWVKVTIKTNSAGIEKVIEVLEGLGITGVEMEDAGEFREILTNADNQWDYIDEGLINQEIGWSVSFYTENDNNAKDTLAKVGGAVAKLRDSSGGAFGDLLISTEVLDDSIWLEKWKEFYKPFRVGQRLIIRPLWEDYEPSGDDVVCAVNPGHVFGTGQHQSTKLCLAELEKYVTPGCKVLDIGCGSGILAIAALRLGAEYAVLTEIEKESSDIINENLGANDITTDRYRIFGTDIIKDRKLLDFCEDIGFEVITANIVTDVIIKLAPLMGRLLKKDGVFISSGIIRERLEEVKAAISSGGFEIVSVEIMDEWASVTGRWTK